MSVCGGGGVTSPKKRNLTQVLKGNLFSKPQALVEKNGLVEQVRKQCVKLRIAKKDEKRE